MERSSKSAFARPHGETKRERERDDRGKDDDDDDDDKKQRDFFAFVDFEGLRDEQRSISMSESTPTRIVVFSSSSSGRTFRAVAAAAKEEEEEGVDDDDDDDDAYYAQEKYDWEVGGPNDVPIPHLMNIYKGDKPLEPLQTSFLRSAFQDVFAEK